MKIMQEFLFLIIGFSCRLVDSQMTSFNCSNDAYAYTRPNTGLMFWNDAQKICRKSNATLPIVDNPQSQSCFAAALSYFQINRNGGWSLTDVWLGASSSGGDPKIWKWLDGSLYNGRIDKSDYRNNYAFVTILKRTQSASIFSSAATTEYYYICLYPTTDSSVCKNGSNQTAYIRDGRCFVKYNEALSWFNARNRCLNNSGDLATFSDISLLSGLNDSNWYTNFLWKGDDTYYDPHWIGLRSSWWNWSDAVTALSTDVTFTRWDNSQPDEGYYPQCIITASTDYSRWKDTGCNSYLPFICQVKLAASTPASTETPVRRDSTSISITSIPSPTPQKETPESAIYNNDNKGNNALAIGLGVGLGVGFLLIATVIIVLILLKRKGLLSSRRKEAIPRGSQPLPDVTSPPVYADIQVISNNETSDSYDNIDGSKTATEYAPLEILRNRSTEDNSDSTNIAIHVSRTNTLAPPGD